MFPEPIRNVICNVGYYGFEGTKSLVSFTRQAAWIAVTSFTILALPIMFDNEKSQVEQSQIQQQRQVSSVFCCYLKIISFQSVSLYSLFHLNTLLIFKNLFPSYSLAHMQCLVHKALPTIQINWHLKTLFELVTQLLGHSSFLTCKFCQPVSNIFEDSHVVSHEIMFWCNEQSSYFLDCFMSLKTYSTS